MNRINLVSKLWIGGLLSYILFPSPDSLQTYICVGIAILLLGKWTIKNYIKYTFINIVIGFITGFMCGVVLGFFNIRLSLYAINILSLTYTAIIQSITYEHIKKRV